MKLLILIMTMPFLVACSTFGEQAMTNSGSGYADLEGSIINYSYEDFGGFSLIWADHKVRWDAMHGYYYDMQAETVPQVSKVADDIYFTSWGTLNGGDNVVHDFNAMTVHAHLNPGSPWIPMDNIYGVVHCKDTPDCVVPAETMSPSFKTTAEILAENAELLNLPPRRRRGLYITEPGSSDIAARNELEGLAITYETPFGTTRIEVDGVETRITENQESMLVYPTNATKIADGIYFISWVGGGPGGSHVVFNRQTMKAFDQISPIGERAEAIYDLTCFGSVMSCE
ncbi:MAG: hypothetical protein P8J61_04870 [Gammaproteobacteria bacterium]|nr:hypothetical protein [Gammaproteobacteria bacterium]